MKFHNFHGPILFSRTFQLLENGHFFQELSRPVATLSIVAALLVQCTAACSANRRWLLLQLQMNSTLSAAPLRRMSPASDWLKVGQTLGHSLVTAAE